MQTGISVEFNSKDEFVEWLQRYATSKNSRVAKTGKTEGTIQGAKLFTFHGGLVVCVVPIKNKEKRYIYNVPYIIVDDTTLDPPNGEGIGTLQGFIEQYWGGNKFVAKPTKNGKVKNLTNNEFPPMLIDLVATLQAMTQMELPITIGNVPDYQAAVHLRLLAAKALQTDKDYYALIDTARDIAVRYPLHGMTYQHGVKWVKDNLPALFTWLRDHNYINPNTEEENE